MSIKKFGLKHSLRSSPTPLVMAIAGILLLSGCATPMKSPDGAIAARNRLELLQNNPQLASRATIAIRKADNAVTQAETPLKDKALSEHLVFVATREVDVAWAQAETRLLEDQRASLSEERDTARLNSRTREADRARSDAEQARSLADQARSEAESARREAEQARTDSQELQRQISELNAKATERGLVVTLGDMLFETGKSELKGNALGNLSKLASFLKTYPDRTLIIEGHTDSVGNNESNFLLSQRRAESVRNYLLEQGISNNRLSAAGKGEDNPIASNDSVSGRALNRRVEVIIANPTGTSTQ